MPWGAVACAGTRAADTGSVRRTQAALITLTARLTRCRKSAWEPTYRGDSADRSPITGRSSAARFARAAAFLLVTPPGNSPLAGVNAAGSSPRRSQEVVRLGLCILQRRPPGRASASCPPTGCERLSRLPPPTDTPDVCVNLAGD